MSFSRNFIFQFPSHAVEMLFERDDVSATKIINRFDFVYKLYSLVCRVRINAQLVLQTSIKRVRESERGETENRRTNGRTDGWIDRCTPPFERPPRRVESAFSVRIPHGHPFSIDNSKEKTEEGRCQMRLNYRRGRVCCYCGWSSG